MIGHGEFNDDAVRAATRDDDVRGRASRDRRAARRARSQRATGSRGIVGHGGGAHLVQALDVGQVNLLQEIGFRGSHGVRGTCDWLRRRRRSLRSREWRVRRKSRRLCRTRRVGTCFELGEAPAVLYTARRGAAGGTTGCGNASASALVSSAVTTIATRMARSAPCAGTRACPRRSGPRAADVAPLRTVAQSPLRSSVAATSPPRPEAHPLRAHSRARSSHNSSTSVATTTAPGRRCFGRTASPTC